MIEAAFGLVGVFVGSFLTIAKDSFADRKRRNEDGSYSAIRLVCILHEYADACVDVVEDNGTYLGYPAGRTEHGVPFLEPQVRQPIPPQYPDDIAWRSLPEGMMHKILGLRNKARTTDRFIFGSIEYEVSPPDYSDFFDARQEGYARLGYDALRLAEELEEKYKIEASHKANLGYEWDAKEFLQNKILKFEKLKKEQEVRQAALDKEMQTASQSESKNNDEK